MHQFDQDMALTAVGQLEFSCQISDEYSIAGVPDGGYIMALMAKAMAQVSQKQAMPIITANFIGRALAGPAQLRIEKLGSSRRYQRLQASLIQEGEERTRAFGTFSQGQYDGPLERHYEADPPQVADLESCIKAPPMLGLALWNQVDMRLDPACAGWLRGESGGRSELKGWISFREPRVHDYWSLLLMADAFPPPVLASLGPTAWVPTLEMSTSLRNLPQSQWLKVRFRTRFINHGLLAEDGELWDDRGELVALSRQTAQFRPAM